MDQTTLRAFRKDSRTMVRELGFLRAEWAPAGMSYAQVHLLLELSTAGQLRPGDLVDRLRSDPASISRSIKALLTKGLIRAAPDPSDRRQRHISLLEAGRAVVNGIDQDADSHVRSALALLDPVSRASVAVGMRAYAKALSRLRRQQGIQIRPIRVTDNPEVTALIRSVMPEFGADAPGFAFVDPEVDAMFEAYQHHRSAYWVVVQQGRVVGGAGYAPLRGGAPGTVELQKMYFLPETRGLGLGAKLMDILLVSATAEGFDTMTIETLEQMHRARRLYASFGFERVAQSMGDTGHHGCDAFYRRRLP
jgi:putative acetyltransferase